jgi:hypothetical protein
VLRKSILLVACILVCATSAIADVTVNFSPRSGPIIQCPKIGNCSAHWTGKGQQAPTIALGGLHHGVIVRAVHVGGVINWGG